MFIGENLNEKQIAVLQAVADACGGCQFARIKGSDNAVKETAERCPSRFRVLYNREDRVPFSELIEVIEELEAEGLVERKEIKGKPHVGLTEDGARCNHIDLPFPLW